MNFKMETKKEMNFDNSVCKKHRHQICRVCYYTDEYELKTALDLT